MSLTALRWPLVSLYLLAGLPLGIFGDVVPVFLRSEGMSLSELGSYSALYLPYSCKVLLAPLVDRTGRLRRWLMGCGGLLAGAYGWLAYASVAPTARSLAGALLLMTSASALFDIALDATFASTLAGASAPQHGSANAWRLSAFKAAMVLVGSAGVLLGGAYGFGTTFVGVALLHVLVLALVPFGRFADAKPTASGQKWLQEGLLWLRTATTLRAFALAFAYKLSIATMLWMEKAFWLDRGLTLREIGLTTAATGLLGTVLGANLGSRLAHRFGFKPLLVAGLLLQAGLGASYLLLAQLPASVPTLAIGLAISGLTFGLSTAALMNLITQLCQPQHAATQFAALTGCYALARSLGGFFAGHTAGNFGYPALFTLVLVLPLPAAAMLLYSHRRGDALQAAPLPLRRTS